MYLDAGEEAVLLDVLETFDAKAALCKLRLEKKHTA